MKHAFILALTLAAGIFVSNAQSIYSTKGNFRFVEELKAPYGYTFGPGRLDYSGKNFYCGLDDENGITRIFRFSVKNPGHPVPIEGPFNVDEYSVFQPTLSADGSVLVYVSSQEDSWIANDLYMALSTGSDQYDSGRPIEEVNDPQDADAYPWLSADGLTLYFTHDNNILYATRANTSEMFSEPRPLRFQDSSEVHVMTCWVDHKGKELYFISSGSIYKSKRISEGLFTKPELFTDEFEFLDFISSLSFDKKKKNLWLYLSDENDVTHILHYKRK